jgi:LmbE family N-acetylglucosaminyl deacetylase
MEPISRRTVLGQASLLSSAGVIGLPRAATTQPARSDDGKDPSRKLKVIVTGGHPGDPEFGCGGTVARYAELGHEVVLLYLNDGEWPPDRSPGGSDGRRARETAKACEILRARPLYAGQRNGRAVVDPANYEAFRKLLEAQRPDVVFTHWPIDNHADHRAISMLTYDAWLKLGKRFALYFHEVSSGEDTVHFSPTHYVDITLTEPRKRQACYAHASQTPGKYYSLQEMVTRMRGIESGHHHAESYIRHVQSPDFGLPMA